MTQDDLGSTKFHKNGQRIAVFNHKCFEDELYFV